MQIHIHDNYNILYKGQIRLGEQSAEVQPEVFYNPKRYGSTEDLLHDVRVRFTPGTDSTPPSAAKREPRASRSLKC